MKALVVDDEKNERERASRILQRQGYEVLQASTYSDALDVFDLNRDVNLLLVDASLPDGNGCALAIALRKLNPRLRVLFVAFEIGSNICRSYGMTVKNLHFLSKPFQDFHLAKRLQKVMNAAEPFPPLYALKTFRA